MTLNVRLAICVDYKELKLFFPLPLIPYSRLARRLVTGPVSLDSIAIGKEILSPQETMTIRPAVILPGQLDRVKDSPEKDPWFAWTPAAKKIADVVATEVTEPATIAYRLKNAVLYDGSIYSASFRYPFSPRSDQSVFQTKGPVTKHIRNGALASTYLGTRFFGHWLADDATRYLLAEDAGDPICVRRSLYIDQARYAEAFCQEWTPVDRAYIDNLIIFEDNGQNSDKKRRYETLRSRIKKSYAPLGSNNIVYLIRGARGARRLVSNEQEIIDILSINGGVILDIDCMNTEYIIKTIMGAKIVISIEGSHLYHCMYTLPQGGSILILNPADRFTAVVRSWAGCIDFRVGIVVGNRSDAGYNFPVGDILKTMDLLGA